MIRAKGGEVAFKGTRSNIMAEAVTALRALKDELSEEEYKIVIGLADKSEEQVKDEAEGAREMLKSYLDYRRLNMSIKKRNYYMGGKKHTVELKYDGYMYTVISDGVLFKQTPNELFAVQVFNEI